MLLTILVFIVILALLVLVHEWGHFFAARKLKVAVEEFGFGFPPRAWGTKKGNTTYSVNWLPLGGFVKLKGESGEAKGEPDSFASQKAYRRSIILVAGVAMNIVLAWILLSIGLMVGVPTSLEESQISRANELAITIAGVYPNTPAQKAGVEPGDTITKIDGVKIEVVKQLQDYVASKGKHPIKFTIKSKGDETIKTITPDVLPESKGRTVIGVSLLQTGILQYPWYESIIRGAGETYYLTKEIILAFGKLFKDLIFSHQVPSDIAGPVGIAVLTGQVVHLGFIYVLQFAALLSLNLAIINILPFPALDGGRVLFVIIEKIRRKPNNEKIEAIVHNIGFAILMLLVLLVTYRDIVRLSGTFFSRLGGLFG